jgi:hypothetical protein
METQYERADRDVGPAHDKFAGAMLMMPIMPNDGEAGSRQDQKRENIRELVQVRKMSPSSQVSISV